MKTLELEPSLEGTKLTFDLPADVAAAIAAHPGRKLQLNVPDDEPAVPVPAPGDGPGAWARWHRSLGTLSEDFECPSRDEDLDEPPADLAGMR